MDRTQSGKCGRCGESFGPGEGLSIPGLGAFHFGGCSSSRMSEDEARVVHEIEDENLIVHVYRGGSL